jgi:hypothetical protein
MILTGGQKTRIEMQTIKIMHEVSDGSMKSLGNWTGDHFCYLLTKNLSTFCLCPKTLWDAKLKGDRIINLVEEISSSPELGHVNLLAVAWLFLLLLKELQ